jgi:hypothetical protein
VSNTGALDRSATCSISSINALKRLFFVAIPLFK